ncbi:MAG TPA: orotate phosphoribosyltransferase [Anaerolineae bacterium]|nr:orotate phosphoribosyltransferase [Anaerolineae bacterium]
MKNGPHRIRLLDLLRRDGLYRGEVELSSGAHSNYYVDGKMVTLSPEGAWLTAQLVLDLLADEDLHPDAIGGLTIGADPIVAAVACISHERGKPIPAFIVRQERKLHGKQKLIEGPLARDSDVVIVDDVVTKGGSIRGAIEAAEDFGCRVVKVIALVDRLEGAAEEKLRGYSFTSIFTRDDLLETNERTRAEAAKGTLR